MYIGPLENCRFVMLRNNTSMVEIGLQIAQPFSLFFSYLRPNLQLFK